MDPDDPYYVQRSLDSVAVRHLMDWNVPLTIKGARQTGKSSLGARLIRVAQRQNESIATVFVDFQLLDNSHLESPERFYPWFLTTISESLDLPSEMGRYWEPDLRGRSQSASRFMSHGFLPRLNRPLLVVMDEVDKLFSTTFYVEFFTMLRSWHNQKGSKPIWKLLQMALITSSDPAYFIQDIEVQSPFNVCETIEMGDFTLSEVLDLNKRHGVPLKDGDVEAFHEYFGGQPFLTRRALYELAEGSTWPLLQQRSTADDGPFRDHLKFYIYRLHVDEQLRIGMKSVVQKASRPTDAILDRLQGLGLVKCVNGVYQPRCTLYENYFARYFKREF